MNLDNIDWNGMWNEVQGKLNPESEPDEEKRWDRIAPLFRQWMEVDDYPVKLLFSIQLKPEWSVLDVGCGTGAIAIGAAMRAKSVTALDISSRMLEILKTEAERRTLRNITCVHRSWQDIRPGEDILPHDVVITSRSIARTGDLKESLIKIDQLARRYAYVTAWGGGERSLNRGLREALGHPYHDPVDYVYVFNILHQIGIRPNVLQLECTSRTFYPSVEDALENYRVMFNLTPAETVTAREYLRRYLIRQEDGKYLVPDSKPVWSLIWWKKD